MQDSAGFYWVCSFGGLVRFDGTSFKAYRNSEGLMSYHVRHMFEERHNRYWICNQHDLLLFDGEHFKRIQTPVPGVAILNRVFRVQDGRLFYVPIRAYTRSRAIPPGRLYSLMAHRLKIMMSCRNISLASSSSLSS